MLTVATVALAAVAAANSAASAHAADDKAFSRSRFPPLSRSRSFTVLLVPLLASVPTKAAAAAATWAAGIHSQKSVLYLI